MKKVRLSYLAFAPIILVNNDGVFDILHHNIFIDDASGYTWGFSTPSLDSCPICWVCQSAILHKNVANTFVPGPFTKASNTGQIKISQINCHKIMMISPYIFTYIYAHKSTNWTSTIKDCRFRHNIIIFSITINEYFFMTK